MPSGLEPLQGGSHYHVNVLTQNIAQPFGLVSDLTPSRRGLRPGGEGHPTWKDALRAGSNNINGGYASAPSFLFPTS